MEGPKISDVQVRETTNDDTGIKLTERSGPGLTSLEITQGAPAPAPNPFGINYVTDKRGRRIGLKKLKPSARFALAESVQTKTPSGEMQAIFAASVISINDEGFPPVKDMADLMRRLDELDDDGLAAITPELLKLYGLALDQKDIDTAKN